MSLNLPPDALNSAGSHVLSMPAQQLAAEHLHQEISFTSRSGRRVRGRIELLVHDADSVRIKLSTERASIYLRHETVVTGVLITRKDVAFSGQLNGTHIGKVLVFMHGAQCIHALLKRMEVNGGESADKNMLLIYKTRSRDGFRRLGPEKPLTVRMPSPEDLLTTNQKRTNAASAQALMTTSS